MKTLPYSRLLFGLLVVCFACEDDTLTQHMLPAQSVVKQQAHNTQPVSFVFTVKDRKDGRYLVGSNSYTRSKIYVNIQQGAVASFTAITQGGQTLPAKPSSGNRNPKVLLSKICPGITTPFKYQSFFNPDRGEITYIQCKPNDLTAQVHVDPRY